MSVDKVLDQCDLDTLHDWRAETARMRDHAANASGTAADKAAAAERVRLYTEALAEFDRRIAEKEAD